MFAWNQKGNADARLVVNNKLRNYPKISGNLRYLHEVGPKFPIVVKSSMKFLIDLCDNCGMDSMTSIHSLPPEVLGLVFECCENPTQRGYQPISRTRPPISLMQVCRLWSDVARGTPALWTNFHITSETLESRHFLHFLDLYVQFSRSLPLSVVISFDEEEDAHKIDDRGDMPLFMVAIQRTFIRCKSFDVFPLYVEFDTSPSPMRLLFPVGSTTSMPILERFHISQERTWPETCGRIDAPRLERLDVRVSLAGFDQVFSYHGRPSALKRLLFDYMTSVLPASCIFPILQSSPHLNHLSLTFGAIKEPFSTTILSLPSLRTLDINWERNPGQVQSFLQLLDLPSLQVLQLCCEDMVELMFESLFRSPCWNRTLPHLERITLSSFDLTYSNFGSILSRCSKLQALELARCRGLTQTVAFLTRADHIRKVEGPFLRRLKLVSWDSSAVVGDQRMALLHMITQDVTCGILRDLHLDMPFYSLSQEDELKSLCETHGVRSNIGLD